MSEKKRNDKVKKVEQIKHSFTFDFGQLQIYKNGERVNPADNYARFEVKFSKEVQIWEITVTILNRPEKLLFEVSLDSDFGIDIIDGIITWVDTKSRNDLINYAYIVENDFDWSQIKQFQEIFEQAFEIPLEFQSGVIKDYEGPNKIHADEREHYGHKYTYFVPSLLSNKVLAVQGYVINILWFDESIDQFNNGKVVIEKYDNVIIKAILINFEEELVYYTKNQPKSIKIYSFIKERITAEIDFGQEIESIANIQQELCTNSVFYVLHKGQYVDPLGKYPDKKASKDDQFITTVELLINRDGELWMAKRGEFILKKDKGKFIHIATDKTGLILLLSQEGYIIMCTESPVKNIQDFRKFKVKIKTKDYFGVDIFTNPWNGNTGILFSGDAGVKYIYWKNPSDKKTSKIDSVVKKTSFEEDKKEEFSIPRFIPGKINMFCEMHQDLINEHNELNQASMKRKNSEVQEVEDSLVNSVDVEESKNEENKSEKTSVHLRAWRCTPDESFALWNFGNRILRWKTTILENKAFGGFTEHPYFAYDPKIQ